MSGLTWTLETPELVTEARAKFDALRVRPEYESLADGQLLWILSRERTLREDQVAAQWLRAVSAVSDILIQELLARLDGAASEAPGSAE